MEIIQAPEGLTYTQLDHPEKVDKATQKVEKIKERLMQEWQEEINYLKKEARDEIKNKNDDRRERREDGCVEVSSNEDEDKEIEIPDSQMPPKPDFS